MVEIKELAEFDDSLRAIVRKAYDLGRSDALKKVVNVLNEDRPSEDRLALMAPETVVPVPEEQAPGANQAKISTAGPPWWAWRVR